MSYDIHGNPTNRDIHGNSMDRNIHGNRPSDIHSNLWGGRPLVGPPAYGGGHWNQADHHTGGVFGTSTASRSASGVSPIRVRKSTRGFFLLGLLFVGAGIAGMHYGIDLPVVGHFMHAFYAGGFFLFAAVAPEMAGGLTILAGLVFIFAGVLTGDQTIGQVETIKWIIGSGLVLGGGYITSRG